MLNCAATIFNSANPQPQIVWELRNPMAYLRKKASTIKKEHIETQLEIRMGGLSSKNHPPVYYDGGQHNWK